MADELLLQRAVRRAEELATDNAFLKSVGVASIDGDNEGGLGDTEACPEPEAYAR
jgi:hypothetical protein